METCTAGQWVRFAFIEVWKEEWPVEFLCKVMWVTSRGFRAWQVRPMSQRQRDDMVILAHIREQHRLSLESYGRPRMTEELQELGVNVGHRSVGRLMRDNGIKIIRTQKYKVTTDSNHAFNIAPNLLDQDFSADGSNQKCPLGIMLCLTLSGNRRAICPIFGRTKGGFTLLSFLICILGV
jgi:putative transposase